MGWGHSLFNDPTSLHDNGRVAAKLSGRYGPETEHQIRGLPKVSEPGSSKDSLPGPPVTEFVWLPFRSKRACNKENLQQSSQTSKGNPSLPSGSPRHLLRNLSEGGKDWKGFCQ